jgi:hypothetical protein
MTGHKIHNMHTYLHLMKYCSESNKNLTPVKNTSTLHFVEFSLPRGLYKRKGGIN